MNTVILSRPAKGKTLVILALLMSIMPCISVDSLAQDTIGFFREEMNLRVMFQRAKLTRQDGLKRQIHDSISEKLSQILSIPESFSYPFDSLKSLGKVVSPDGKLRILSWNDVSGDIHYHYYGFIQFNPKGKDGSRLIRLKDNASLEKNAENAVFTPENWYGCLVYRILQNRWDGQDYYTLLESDMNDIMSGKKIIDVLWFDKTGMARFGKPIFRNEKGQVVNRVVFEFTSQAVMSLLWEPRVDMILYDHLSPIQPGMEGNFKFYGPDMSIDGFRFEKGFWVYVPNVDMQHPK